MDLQKRKPNRLKNYDYSQNGLYFITICTKEHRCILSNVIVGASIARPSEIQLTDIGITVEKGINGIEEHYKNIFVDHYVIMPNHIHLIIRIENTDGRAMLAPTISRIIQQFKGYVTKQLGKSIWQKLYYDHIIRNEEDYFIKQQYIENNPSKWLEDELYKK
ncbi:MAG: transposase [Eubacterium sp.]|nr:transposase [Eubacterium sp.]